MRKSSVTWLVIRSLRALVTDAAWKHTLEGEAGFTALRHDDRRWQPVALLGEVSRGQNVWGYPPKDTNATESAEAKLTKCRADVRVLADAVRMYRVMKGKLPESLEVLAEKDDRGRSILEQVPVDPYGNEYILREGERPNEFEVICMGPDRAENTEDDVSSKPRK